MQMAKMPNTNTSNMTCSSNV